VSGTQPQAWPASGRDDGEWPVALDLRGMRFELRRRRWFLASLSAVLALLGLLLGMAFGTSSKATTTLLLVHGSNQTLNEARATDLGLLYTRVLAERVIADQGLPLEPGEFLSTVSVDTTAGQLLSITVAAPTADEALARSAAVARMYLAFREQVLTQQSRELIKNYQAQIDELQVRERQLTAEIAQLQRSTSGSAAARTNEAIAERSEAAGQVSELRQLMQAEEVRVAATLGASRVIDDATLEPAGRLKRIVLGFGSGLVAGLALAFALVVGHAVLNDRPRRRDDIAAALGVPIPISVGRVEGPWPWHRAARRRAAASVVNHLEGTPAPLAVAMLGIRSEQAVSAVTIDVAQALAARGDHVRVVDITEHGVASRTLRGRPSTAPEPSVAHRDGDPNRVEVVRPEEIPTISHAPTWSLDWSTSPRAREHHETERNTAPKVTLVVADISPATGADHVADRADQAVLVVKAGAATEERLRSCIRLIRTAGLHVRHAVLTASSTADDTIAVVHTGDQPQAPSVEAQPGLVESPRDTVSAGRVP